MKRIYLLYPVKIYNTSPGKANPALARGKFPPCALFVASSGRPCRKVSIKYHENKKLTYRNVFCFCLKRVEKLVALPARIHALAYFCLRGFSIQREPCPCQPYSMPPLLCRNLLSRRNLFFREYFSQKLLLRIAKQP